MVFAYCRFISFYKVFDKNVDNVTSDTDKEVTADSVKEERFKGADIDVTSLIPFGEAQGRREDWMRRTGRLDTTPTRSDPRTRTPEYLNMLAMQGEILRDKSKD